jgi:hypothetical protein
MIQIPVIDSHEHFLTMPNLKKCTNFQQKGIGQLSIPFIFSCGYIFLDPTKNIDYWAKEIQNYRGSGYLRSWIVAMDDLYDLKPPITVNYLSEMKKLINEAYSKDILTNQYSHFTDILQNRMNVKNVIVHIAHKDHLEFPGNLCRGAFHIDPLANEHLVPTGKAPYKEGTRHSNLVYWYAQEKLGMNLEDITSFNIYLDLTNKFLSQLKQENQYIALKTQQAYYRPIYFEDRTDQLSTIATYFNNPHLSEKEKWEFSDFMMHYIFDWFNQNWRLPIQVHTGLARIYDGGSDAMKMSNIFQKYPELHFDLFHGNYPFRNLPGMLHQIPNISANLCWLPVISPSSAQQTLTELIEVGDMNCGGSASLPYYVPYHEPSMRTIQFGGDCELVESSYGAYLVSLEVLVRTLEDLMKRNLLLEADAIDIAKQVLYSNPKRIFNL